MKKSLVLIPMLVALMTSCKKKEDPRVYLVISTPDDTSTFRGFLTSSTWTSSIGGSYQTGQGAQARFHTIPAKRFGGANDVDLDYLSVNTRSLTNKNMFAYMLISPPDSLNLAIDSWLVKGTSGIPSFSYTNTTPFPDCSNFNVIPDSISKSKGYTFTVDKVSDITFGGVSIGDGVAAMLNYSLTPGTNVIQITPSDLAALATGTAGYITLGLQKTKRHCVSGRNFQFIKEAYLAKPFKITP